MSRIIKPEHPDYPSLRWHPETGEAQVFNAPHEVPDGWLDRHPKSVSGDDKAAAKGDQTNTLPLNKAEVIEALKAGNIPFKPQAGVKSLYELLETSLKAHLASENIPVPEGADVPALLILVNGNKSE